MLESSACRRTTAPGAFGAPRTGVRLDFSKGGFMVSDRSRQICRQSLQPCKQVTVKSSLATCAFNARKCLNQVRSVGAFPRGLEDQMLGAQVRLLSGNIRSGIVTAHNSRVLGSETEHPETLVKSRALYGFLAISRLAFLQLRCGRTGRV